MAKKKSKFSVLKVLVVAGGILCGYLLGKEGRQGSRHRCPECGTTVDYNATECEECGAYI